MNAFIRKDRGRIEQIDRKIIRLIGARIRASRRIGASKGEDINSVLYDREREETLYDLWSRTAAVYGLSGYHLGRILRELLNYSRRVQAGVLDESSGQTERPVTRVGFEGIDNSYSCLTVKKLFSHRDRTCVEPIGFRTTSAAIEALIAKQVDYALLPIENTIAGSINNTYRLLQQDPSLVIVDEEVWAVEHCLAALPGTSLADVRIIRSHPVALQQCERFLADMPWAATEAYFDTAAAAESLIHQKDPKAAAVCSQECAQALGLAILKTEIADHPDNFTRFVLVGTEAQTVDRRIPCKTSLRFTVCHRHGALAQVLQILDNLNLNLTKLESRPRPESPWEYEFFADVIGHQEDDNLAAALKEVRRHTNHLRVLGSYPRRDLEMEQVPVNGNGHKPDHSDQPVALVDTSRTMGAPEQSGGNGDRPAATLEPITLFLGRTEIGPGRFVVIAGPCAVESREQMHNAAEVVRDAGAHALRGGAFKPRTSPTSFQGLGYPGLEMLGEAGRIYELPTVTEVLRTEDVARIAQTADALQVGARSMQNFALLRELGKINKPIVLKRGMSATTDELLKAAEYITSEGNQRVILCERGIRTFEPSTRSTLDLSAITVLRERTHLPIIVDPSHAAGRRELVVPLALAAAAAGADGLLVEVHPKPEEALCDGRQALTVDDLHDLMRRLGPIVAAQSRSM
jgi:3-deoxy-7-phosphoheptulonate synthase